MASHVREEIRTLLKTYRRTVGDFATCEALLDAYHTGREGSLLVHAHLSAMTGHELLRHLCDLGYRLLAILITRNSDVPIAVAAMEAGATDFIKKTLAATICSLA